VEADEDTDPEVGNDVANRQEASSTAKPKHKTRAATTKQPATTAAAKVGAAKTAKLEVEKKKRKRRVCPSLIIETPVIPTHSTRERSKMKNMKPPMTRRSDGEEVVESRGQEAAGVRVEDDGG
jgi:precorrin isomerase